MESDACKRIIDSRCDKEARVFWFDFRINIQLLNGNVVAISIIHSTKWQLILVLCFRWHETTLRAPFQFIRMPNSSIAHCICAFKHLLLIRCWWACFTRPLSLSPSHSLLLFYFNDLLFSPSDYSNLVRLHARIHSSDTKLKLCWTVAR